MEITEVRIKLMDEPGERLKAFCSITFDDCFVVRDLKIIEGSSGPFVAMPSRKLTIHCPRCRCKNHLRASYCNQCGSRLEQSTALKDDEGRMKLYADIAHPINSACREMIQSRVITAFEDEKARSKLPGYIPSYVDFDGGDDYTPSGREPQEQAAPAPHQAHVEPAEKPKGPHKAPSHQPQSQPPKPHNEGFGAGVFDE